MPQSIESRKVPPEKEGPRAANKGLWGKDPARTAHAPALSSEIISGSTISLIGEIDVHNLETIFTQIQPNIYTVQPGDTIEVTDEPHEVFAIKVIREKSYRQLVIDKLVSYCSTKNFDSFATPEAKGWFFAGALAHLLNKKLIPVRKFRKANPSAWKASIDGNLMRYHTYRYHYGKAKLAFPKDVAPGERIIIVDDDVIGSGTARATIEVVSQAGGIVVGLAFAIEWLQWGARAKLRGWDFFSALKAWRVL